MKKTIFCILFLLFSPSLGMAACHTGFTSGTCNVVDGEEAGSCARADVAAAITAVATGDTVSIPAGECTWDTYVSIPSTKKITLRGAGMDNTVITLSGTAIEMNLSGSRITGFGFITSGGTTIDVKGKGWRIDNCKFHRPSDGVSSGIHANGTNVTWDNYPVGLIDNNVFINTKILVDGGGNFAKMSEIWASPFTLGDGDAVYIENNTFNRTNSERWNFVDGSRGAKSVQRYNTFTNGYIMVHGLQSDTERGYLRWETYRNKLHSGNNQYLPIRYRGGIGVIFDNEISGDYNSRVIDMYLDRAINSVGVAGRCNGSSSWDGNLTIDHDDLYGDSGTGTHDGSNESAVLIDSTKTWTANVMTYSVLVRPGATVYNVTDGSKCVITGNTATTVTCTLSGGTNNYWNTGDTYTITDGYPCRDQIGRSTDDSVFDKASTPYPTQEDAPVYFWLNRNKGIDGLSDSIAGVSRTNGSQYHIKPDRDYYNETADFNGTSGVGVGLLASRPSTCTAGVAYWATDQGSWNKTVGGDQGLLYKCTATDTWELYYTPYEYPHPLQDGTHYMLTLTVAGDGSGSVVSSPTGIDSSTSTTWSFAEDTEVTLTAAPSGDDTVAWSGTDGAECTGLTCTVTMSAARAVTATFTDVAPVQWVVTRSYVGSGSTSPAEGDEVVNNDATATTTQTPSDHWMFAGWSGTCGCTGTDSCAPTVTANCTIIATWAEDAKKSITITHPGNGELITSDKCGLYCGQGYANYDCACDWYAEDVTLTCTPAIGYYGCTMTGDDCTSGVCTPNDQTVTVTSINGRAATINKDGSTATATVNRDGSTATATIVR